jgi:hypothetical protein
MRRSLHCHVCFPSEFTLINEAFELTKAALLSSTDGSPRLPTPSQTYSQRRFPSRPEKARSVFSATPRSTPSGRTTTVLPKSARASGGDVLHKSAPFEALRAAMAPPSLLRPRSVTYKMEPSGLSAGGASATALRSASQSRAPLGDSE